MFLDRFIDTRAAPTTDTDARGVAVGVEGAVEVLGVTSDTRFCDPAMLALLLALLMTDFLVESLPTPANPPAPG